jgi:hypothetical protein
MKPSICLKYITLIGISILAISQANSQSTWYNYNFDRLDKKYEYSTNRLDARQMRINKINFLTFQTKYLESATDSLIEVSVKVIRDSTNEELSGYNVFAKPAMSIDRADVISFNPTKNAIKKLRPGKKTFWIERNGVKIKEQRGWGVSISDRNSHLVIFNVNN